MFEERTGQVFLFLHSDNKQKKERKTKERKTEFSFIVFLIEIFGLGGNEKNCLVLNA